MNSRRVAALVKQLLVEIGEDPQREGLRRTPERVARAWEFLTKGYREDIREIVRGAVFRLDTDNMIVARDIEVYSLCEHHMLPFFGRCHVGYIAKRKIIGVSKLARIVDYYARRPQVQERLTMQIAAELKTALETDDVAVYIEARHHCVAARGVSDTESMTITSRYFGKFLDPTVKGEFLANIKRR